MLLLSDKNCNINDISTIGNSVFLIFRTDVFHVEWYVVEWNTKGFIPHECDNKFVITFCNANNLECVLDCIGHNILTPPRIKKETTKEIS
mgnify:CR=1 FL=1|jgi:hypothetical protein